MWEHTVQLKMVPDYMDGTGRNILRRCIWKHTRIIWADAEQVQTNVSEFNPARANLIRSGIQVTIEYYVKDGVNIATKLTSDGDEKEPYGN